ncbi:ABC transporter permease [Clostridioides difficile]|nr:ABC transporter permease [Clostridioides difficile]MDV9591279.1 ABC transporter permease [Clostridioides difficile]
MIKIINAFKQEFEQIKRDAMLFIVCVSPILCGVFIKFGIPLIQNISLNKFYYQLNLEPYFLMFDLLLAFITPFMFFFASTMVILGEIDDSISNYLIVTPLGKTGYLVSRFGIPGILAFIITMILLIFFSLTRISFLLNLSISLLVLLQGVIISILVISLSSNKLEGMVITKFSGVFMMGILAPFFILNKVQYILFFLPTFWISKAFKEDNYIYMFISIVISLIWILLLFKKFSKKIVK